MNCLICDSASEYYFSKTYSEPPYDEFMKEIGTVDYYKCSNCGFVLSKTHSELDKDIWSKLNYDAHTFFENSKIDKLVNQPPYIDQAMMIKILGEHEVINTESMLDYAAGYGTLSQILSTYFAIDLPIFDAFVTKGDVSRYVNKDSLKKYSLVLNSAMLEHILTRQDIDNLNDLVEPDGALLIHTLICENVPEDPNWFYLKPPAHTAFHTNKSMEILMKQWGYESSLYCPRSKSWILFKKQEKELREIVDSINDELQADYLYLKKGFVDYWKGFN